MMIPGVGINAVQAPLGRFLMIQDGTKCLALRITEHCNFRVINGTPHYTAKYEWFLQTDGSMDFLRPNVQQGLGELSEFHNNTYAAAYIATGPFPILEWSLGDWIYFGRNAPLGTEPPDEEDARCEESLRIALTEWTRLEDVNAKSGTLRWWSKADTQKLAL